MLEMPLLVVFQLEGPDPGGDARVTELRLPVEGVPWSLGPWGEDGPLADPG